jgi:FixJ family two-component response regulator
MAGSAGWIAVVDDDPSVLKALERALRVRAYQAKTYGSALEFLASLPDGLPECIILDIEMPEMSGLELHHHLILSGIRIPTVLISAQRDVIVRERAESAGVVAILTKPLQRPALFAAVAAALAH